MNRYNIIKAVLFSLVLCLLIGLNLSADSKSQNFKLFTDVLDSFGGRDSSTNFSGRIGSGGQPGVITISEGDSFYAKQGYVHTAAFEHGDANGDGKTDIVDLVYLVNYLFKRGPEPVPLETGDVDCPGSNFVDIIDVVYLVNYVFKSGPPPCNF
jgi:hypothetical protein